MASTKSTSFIRGLGRIVWMMVGPALLLLLAFNVAQEWKGWLSPANIAFLVILVAVVIARWHDPETADGNETTPAHIRRFTISMALGGMAVWVSANLLGQSWAEL